MEDDAFPAWPAAEADEPEDEFEGENEEASTDAPDPTTVEQLEEEPAGSEAEDSTNNDEEETVVPVVEPWTLPVRAAPILALQGEEVVEFPLSQHVNGLESTSLIMDDKLMRIVEARYDPDGVRRLNVRMALVKEHISGYSHTHLNLFQKLQGVWWGSIGFGLLSALSAAQGFFTLGSGAFVLAGVTGLLFTKLDLHRLSFSDHGGRHDFYLSGWRQEPYLIHNSTALLGPAFVEFLRTSTLDTEHIDAVIDTIGAPAKPAPELQSAPEPPTPHALQAPVHPEPPVLLPPPSTGTPVQAPVVASNGPPISNPTSPPPQPSPPPPAQPLPPPPAPIEHATPPPAPMPELLPPAPLPPPLAPLPMKSNVDEDALWDDLN